MGELTDLVLEVDFALQFLLKRVLLLIRANAT